MRPATPTMPNTSSWPSARWRAYAESHRRRPRQRHQSRPYPAPITLWPFPYKEIAAVAKHTKGVLCVELNAGQMIEDVRLAVGDGVPVRHFGRMGGIVPNPQEVLDALESDFKH